MAKFSTCVRHKRNDGLYQVYIRVYHNNGLQYINTGLLVNDKGLRTTFTKQGKEIVDITDHIVQKECMSRIEKYAEKCNRVNIDELDCKTLIDMLTQKGDGELSFTEYAKKYINEMINQDRDRAASNYQMAVTRLKEYIGKENILFKELTSKVIQAWIDSMKDSARKKSLYPACIRAIFNEAIKSYNDYDLDIVRIQINPFAKVNIPKQRIPEKRSESAEIIKKILTSKLDFSSNNEGISRKEMAQDVGMMIFCLAGINAADLYDLKDSALKDGWKLCYRRKKTRGKSEKGSYMEITVPKPIRHLFGKYEGKNGKLFLFSKRYANDNDFVKHVNIGLKQICEELELIDDKDGNLKKRKKKPVLDSAITTYTFRHSWATIARNKCGASTADVAFALTHASAYSVTDGYIQTDYSPNDKLNKKVIDYVLNAK